MSLCLASRNSLRALREPRDGDCALRFNRANSFVQQFWPGRQRGGKGQSPLKNAEHAGLFLCQLLFAIRLAWPQIFPLELNGRMSNPKALSQFLINPPQQSVVIGWIRLDQMNRERGFGGA